MLGHFDEIYRRLERLDQEYLAITQALRRIEARLTDEHERREIIERDLADLKQHVAASRPASRRSSSASTPDPQRKEERSGALQ